MRSSRTPLTHTPAHGRTHAHLVGGNVGLEHRLEQPLGLEQGATDAAAEAPAGGCGQRRRLQHTSAGMSGGQPVFRSTT